MQQQRYHQAAKASTGAAQPAPLGNNAESSSPPPLRRADAALQRRLRRVERYRLQSQIRLMIGARGHAEGLEYPFNWHKTAKCRHVRRGGDVEILQSKEHGTCHYGGLVVCGNVRTCPVCGPIIQERRAQEIRQFFDWAYKRRRGGGKVLMITFTFPHTRDQALADQLALMAQAFKRLRSGKRHQRLKERYGMQPGLIRSLEVTYGDNGWHSHTHELYPVYATADAEAVKVDLLERWAKACKAVGLLPDDKVRAFMEHAVDVIDNARESDYLAKQGSEEDFHWGADREVAKASTKHGRKSGRTPFQLADGDERERALFMEYLEAMRRKPSIYWSTGLKALVGLEDETDEQLAEAQDDPASCLGQLTPHDWALIISDEAKAEILTIAETRGISGVRAWLEAAEQRLSGDPTKLARAAAEAQPGRPELWSLGLLDGRFGPLLPDPLCLVSDWRPRAESSAGRPGPEGPGAGHPSCPPGG